MFKISNIKFLIRLIVMRNFWIFMINIYFLQVHKCNPPVLKKNPKQFKNTNIENEQQLCYTHEKESSIQDNINKGNDFLNEIFDELKKSDNILLNIIKSKDRNKCGANNKKTRSSIHKQNLTSKNENKIHSEMLRMFLKNINEHIKNIREKVDELHVVICMSPSDIITKMQRINDDVTYIKDLFGEISKSWNIHEASDIYTEIFNDTLTKQDHKSLNN